MLALGVAPAGAEDWPEWRGKGRLGEWRETGILDAFPADGLEVRWRTPIRAGYAGPAVAGGRVFVVDADRSAQSMAVVERALALDEGDRRDPLDAGSGTPITPASSSRGRSARAPRRRWTATACTSWARRASCTVWTSRTGDVLWRRDYVADYDAELPAWGMSGAPLVDGDLLIGLVGGRPGAKVVAFDKHTGEEVWRALPSDTEPGYSQPLVIEAGGVRQLIVWHPAAVASLDPATGAVYWEQPVRADYGMSVATPVPSGQRLLVSSFYNGALMLGLNRDRPASTVLWKSTSDSELLTEALHAVINTPVIAGDTIYGICSYGQFARA